MACNPVQLQEYLDRELDPAAEEAVKRHLAECVACRRELSALKLLWLELDRAAPDVEPAPELVYQRRKVMIAVREDRRRRSEESRRKASSEARRAAFLWLGIQAAVWRPVLAGMQYIPGIRLLSRPGPRPAKAPAPAGSSASPRQLFKLRMRRHRRP